MRFKNKMNELSVVRWFHWLTCFAYFAIQSMNKRAKNHLPKPAGKSGHMGLERGHNPFLTDSSLWLRAKRGFSVGLEEDDKRAFCAWYSERCSFETYSKILLIREWLIKFWIILFAEKREKNRDRKEKEKKVSH